MAEIGLAIKVALDLSWGTTVFFKEEFVESVANANYLDIRLGCGTLCG